MLPPAMSSKGKILFTLVVIAVATFAIVRLTKKKPNEPGHPPAATSSGQQAGGDSDSPALEFDFLAPGKAPQLPAPRTYKPEGGTVAINLSEYAGYAGLILANGGLEPNEQSWFTQNGGFKVKITLSEEDTWADLHGNGNAWSPPRWRGPAAPMASSSARRSGASTT
jgi:NitT/TauT family transport system substrate-binding protein